jgi:hypothetical protein
LVDQAHHPRAIVHTDRRRGAALPGVERIAHGGEIGRGEVGARKSLVARGIDGDNGIGLPMKR